MVSIILATMMLILLIGQLAALIGLQTELVRCLHIFVVVSRRRRSLGR